MYMWLFSQDMIQSIFLSLNLRLFSTHRLFERKYVLLAYSLFTRLVCQELRTGLGGSLAYVVMEIIYSMIRVLDYHSLEEMKELFPPLCDTLYTLCKSGIQECPEVLQLIYFTVDYMLLYSIISSLESSLSHHNIIYFFILHNFIYNYLYLSLILKSIHIHDDLGSDVI